MDSPIGGIRVHYIDRAVVNVDFLYGEYQRQEAETAYGDYLTSVLTRYFSRKHAALGEPVQLEGTAFQVRVWQRLCEIPFGATETYGSLASSLNTSARAIGNACRANKIPLFVPCHRVVASNGPGGFAGATQGIKLDTKNWLLSHEKQQLLGAIRSRAASTRENSSPIPLT